MLCIIIIIIIIIIINRCAPPSKFWSTTGFFNIQFGITVLQNKAQIAWERI